MNKDLIKKIRIAYNIGQNPFGMEYKEGPPLHITIYKDGIVVVEFDVSEVGYELHGFLIDDKYGFPGAYAVHHMIRMGIPFNLHDMDIIAKWFLKELALAESKFEWLNENL